MSATPRRRFPTTHWSAVRTASQESPSGCRVAMGELLSRYLPVLHHYLVTAKRMRPDTADDLLQSFVLDKVIEDQLLAEADPSRGRFRSFLLKVLDNHLSSTMRKQGAKFRGGGAVSIELREGSEPAAEGTEPADALDTSWAIGVIHETLSRMRAECLGSARPQLWMVFEGRIVGPVFGHSQPMEYERLVASGDFATPAQACNALVTSKRMFERILRTVVGEFVRDKSEVDLEMASLREILSARGA